MLGNGHAHLHVHQLSILIYIRTHTYTSTQRSTHTIAMSVPRLLQCMDTLEHAYSSDRSSSDDAAEAVENAVHAIVAVVDEIFTAIDGGDNDDDDDDEATAAVAHEECTNMLVAMQQRLTESVGSATKRNISNFPHFPPSLLPCARDAIAGKQESHEISSPHSTLAFVCISLLLICFQKTSPVCATFLFPAAVAAATNGSSTEFTPCYPCTAHAAVYRMQQWTRCRNHGMWGGGKTAHKCGVRTDHRRTFLYVGRCIFAKMHPMF